MWTPASMQLDLSRRRISAISFLSNISVGSENSDDGEHSVRSAPKPIRLDCLKNTYVLKDFQDFHRQRKKFQEQHYSIPATSPEALDFSKLVVQPVEPSLRSAPAILPGPPFQTISEENDDDKQVDEVNGFNPHASSSESLHELTSELTTLARRRTVSGTYSEHSGGSSIRELTFVKNITDRQFSDSRLVFVPKAGRSPFAVSSVLPFTKCNVVKPLRSERDVHVSKRHRQNSLSRPLSAINDIFDSRDFLFMDRPDEDTSYNHLLKPFNSMGDHASLEPRNSLMGSWHHVDGFGEDDSSSNVNYNGYSPFMLEGWLIAGKHRTFLPFPSHVTSVIEYVKPSEMKRELNKKFKERFPMLEISFTKLKSIKKELKKIAITECHLDMLTVAQSFVYFELLVLRNRISKTNRKYCAGACLILAAKLNDVKGCTLTLLIEKIESIFRLNRKDLLSAEFAVLLALEFGLHVPTWQIYPHYQRLLYDHS